MLVNVLVIFFGIIISLFIFWKRLREDYSGEIIFNSIFIVFISLFTAHLVSLRFFPVWFFWADFLAVLIGLSTSVYKNKIRFYESLEALVFSLTPLLSLSFLQDAVKNSSLFSFIAFTVILLLIFVFYYIDSHYKNFSWYLSGKIGLSGLSILFLFFLIRAIIATFFPSVLSFSGKFDPLISGLFSLGALGGILYLRTNEK